MSYHAMEIFCKMYLCLNIVFNKKSSSVQFSCSIVSELLQPYELQHARLPCPSLSPRACSNSCPLSWWCHPAISPSVVPFSSCPQSLPASESYPMSQLFVWGGQSIGVSALASFLPKNTQDWSPLEWTGWISLQSKGLSNNESSRNNPHSFVIAISRTSSIMLPGKDDRFAPTCLTFECHICCGFCS